MASADDPHGRRRSALFALLVLAAVLAAFVVWGPREESEPPVVSPLLRAHVARWRGALTQRPRPTGVPAVVAALDELSPALEDAATCSSPRCPAVDALLVRVYRAAVVLDEIDVDLLAHLPWGTVVHDHLVEHLQDADLDGAGLDARPTDLHVQWASLCDHDAGSPLQALSAVVLLRAYAEEGTDDPWRAVDLRAVEAGIRCE